MPTPPITLATDFGEGSAYVAMLKGVLLGLCPEARLVDLSHSLAGDDPFAAAWLLRRAYPYYPAGTVHLLGMDRGLGPSRALLAAAARQHFVAMDEGGLGLVLQHELESGRGAAVWAVPLPAPSPFVARDHLAGLAARLAQGADPASLGQPVADWRRLTLPPPHPAASGPGLQGQVLYVDRFGNLLTNFTPAHAPAATQVQIRGARIARWCSYFGDAPAGELCLLWGAEGWLEIVLPQGSAAQRLGAKTGDPVLLG